MKHITPHLSLCALLLLAPVLAACGSGGGSAASDVAQKTEVETLLGTYLGVAYTILRDNGQAESERDVDSYSGGLALRADGTYVRTIVIDGVETTDIGTWDAQFSVIHFDPAGDDCSYEASYRIHDNILIIDALHPCEQAVRITRHWHKD